MADAEVAICSNPGCDQPGTSACSACKTTFYCCVICQTADWNQHKEECEGHLRKVGMAHLAKARGFVQERNWAQSLRYADLAATKLKQLKDRRLETVDLIDDALRSRYAALLFMSRHREALECAEENYTLWAMNHLRNPSSIRAALRLINCCLHNDKNEDAVCYGHHAMFMINEMTDNLIPVEERPPFLADISRLLAEAIHGLAEDGGYPPAEKQKAGEEAIALARQALEIHTQLHGTESVKVAGDLGTLADVLEYFNNVDDDQVPCLHEQALAIFGRLEGHSSLNVATCEGKLSRMFDKRAKRALDAGDSDKCIVNLELALPHDREAARIFRIVDHVDSADEALCNLTQTLGNLGSLYFNRSLTARGANDLDRELANLELALPHYREAARIYQEINRMDKANESLKNIDIAEKRIRELGTARAAAAAAAAAAATATATATSTSASATTITTATSRK